MRANYKPAHILAVSRMYVCMYVCTYVRMMPGLGADTPYCITWIIGKVPACGLSDAVSQCPSVLSVWPCFKRRYACGLCVWRFCWMPSGEAPVLIQRSRILKRFDRCRIKGKTHMQVGSKPAMLQLRERKTHKHTHAHEGRVIIFFFYFLFLF
jgi:hypothetical protein